MGQLPAQRMVNPKQQMDALVGGQNQNIRRYPPMASAFSPGGQDRYNRMNQRPQIDPPQSRGGSPFGSRNMRQAVMRQPYRPQGGIVPMLRQRQGPSRYGRYGPP